MRLEKRVAFQRSYSTVGKPFLWLSFTSIMAAFVVHHTL
jgi:hypothetical protein